jgi:hypothetical protein
MLCPQELEDFIPRGYVPLGPRPPGRSGRTMLEVSQVPRVGDLDHVDAMGEQAPKWTPKSRSPREALPLEEGSE